MSKTLMESTLGAQHRALITQKHLFQKKRKEAGASLKRGSNKKRKDTVGLICFLLNDESYGIALERTREIVQTEEIVRVPGSPDYFKGMINLRGQVITVLDLKRFLGLERSQLSEDSRVLIVQQERNTIGLLVDKVDEIIRLEKNLIVPPPEGMANGQYVQALGEWSERVITLLDLEKIVPPLSE